MDSSKPDTLCFYALIDDSRLNPFGIDEGDVVTFDAFHSSVRMEAPDWNQEQQANDDERYPVAMFSIERKQLTQNFPQFDSFQSWLKVTLTSHYEGGSVVTFVGAEQQAPLYSLKNLEILESGISALLDALTVIPRPTRSASKRTISSAINYNRQELMVNVVDVGQGGLCAILNGWQVCLFYDLGWPINSQRATAPSQRPDLYCCANPEAPVVLSHWDWDHWGLAIDKITFRRASGFSNIKWHEPALNRPWIVPGTGKGWGGVKLKPFHWRFALRLRRIGRLNVWPTGVKLMEFDHLTIHRTQLSGRQKRLKDPNQNGLVMVVHADRSSSYEPLAAVLLPGDADYPNMPFLHGSHARYEFNGLVATHHGANFTYSACPPALPTARLAISVGMGNSYRHPRRWALDSYTVSGWEHQEKTSDRIGGCTISGNIGLSPLAGFSGVGCMCCCSLSSFR